MYELLEQLALARKEMEEAARLLLSAEYFDQANKVVWCVKAIEAWEKDIQNETN